jgi:hypothetical protein
MQIRFLGATGGTTGTCHLISVAGRQVLLDCGLFQGPRAGRHGRALELWRRARVIDPGDGEWSGKLHAVALGQDPL